MCGIHFVINTEPSSKHNLSNFLEDAFYANQVRGVDSSGLFQVKGYSGKDGKPEVSFFRNAVNGSEFLKDSGVKSMITASKHSRATVCHVRHATQGSVRTENAHPFVTKREDGSRIIGVHNGTLTNWRNKEGASDFTVDSQWLYSKLADDGAKAFEGFEGAWALVWYDSRNPDIMYFARNDKRPLFYATSEDGKAIIGASELGMLGWLADRNNIALQKNDKGIKFFYPPTGEVMEINIRTLEKKFYPYSEYKAGTYVPAVSPVRSTTRSTYTSHITAESWQDTIIGRVRKILDEATIAAKVEEEEDTIPFTLDGDKDSTTPSTEDLNEEELEAAIKAEFDRFVESRKAGVDDDEDDAPAHSYMKLVTSDDKEDLGYIEKPIARRAAAAEERRRAKNKGLFGLVVEYIGYWFEKEENCVYGDVTMKDGKNLVSYDALIRGQSSASSEKYVNLHTMNPSKLVVVGLTEDRKHNNNKPYLILAEVNAEDVVRRFEFPSKRAVN